MTISYAFFIVLQSDVISMGTINNGDFLLFIYLFSVGLGMLIFYLKTIISYWIKYYQLINRKASDLMDSMATFVISGRILILNASGVFDKVNQQTKSGRYYL